MADKKLKEENKGKDMLSFKRFTTILENKFDARINFIKGQWAKKTLYTPEHASTHDPRGKLTTNDEIIDHIAKHADPSDNKKYTQNLVNMYHRGGLKQEDAGRMHEALSIFEKHKGKIANKDLNSYKSLHDLEAVVHPLKDVEAVSENEKERLKKAEGADLVYHNPTSGVMIHRIKTIEGACLYGKGTRWCTASDRYDDLIKKGLSPEQAQARRYEGNAFGSYHPQENLFVISVNHPNFPKDSAGRIPKWQFHRPSSQFMDVEDRSIQKGAFHKLVEHDPHLKEFVPLHMFHIQHGSSKDIDQILSEVDNPNNKNNEYFPPNLKYTKL